MGVWDFIQDQVLGMKWLNELLGMGLSALGLDVNGRIGGSIQFFIYDVLKIMVLLCVLIFAISYMQSYFPPERSKRILGRFHGFWANIISALLAEKIHINPAYLSTLFKNEVGVNYQDYLTAVRIDKAKQLLAGEPMNISQVANAVGYGSARYFSKTFEAQTGIRPAEYRRLRMRRLEG